YGIVVVGRLLVGVAAQQPHRPAGSDVDRRDHDHAARASWTKRSYSSSPAAADFSGWNCVANTFACATAAENERPWSVTPTLSSAHERLDRGLEPGRAERTHARAEPPDPRDHEAVRGRRLGAVRCDADVGADLRERSRHRVEVAHAVVEDGHAGAHRTLFVDGT